MTNLRFEKDLKYIEFNWIYGEWKFFKKITIPIYIEMINNIPNYYYVKIFLSENILGDDSPKWPIYVRH